jgi:hypothetical protein
MSEEQMRDELDYLLFGDAAKECRADNKKVVQFFVPWQKSHIFDKFLAKSNFPNIGYWTTEEGKLIIDDNFMVDVEFADDGDRCISRRLMDVGGELIKSVGEQSGYVRILDIEDSTL